MMAATHARYCLACEKPVKGRTDKKFCDDSCRNHYNNQLKAANNNLVRNINNALGKNRRLLEAVISGRGEIVKTTKEKLLAKGFLFKYITHTQTNRNGSTYFFCYDLGYLPLKGGSLLIIKDGELNSYFEP